MQELTKGHDDYGHGQNQCRNGWFNAILTDRRDIYPLLH